MPIDLEKTLAALRETGDPFHKEVAHDLEILYPLAEKHWLENRPGKPDWHNNAADELIEDMASESIMAIVLALTTKNDPNEMFGAVANVMMNMARITFAIGYDAGEHSEHIVKCQCDKHSPEEN